jgi:hypothetical protein
MEKQVTDYYEAALQMAERLKIDLGCHNDCRESIVLNDGKRRRGYRVTVTRLPDGVSMSKFVGETD